MEYHEVVVDAQTGEKTTRPYTQAEIDAVKAEAPRIARLHRDYILETEVDVISGNALRWSALTDAERQAWADYRQALLDIPQQPSFPHDITWPNKPE